MIYSMFHIFQNTRIACAASRAASPNRNQYYVGNQAQMI